MDAFLKTLDWRVRLIMWIGCTSLAAGLCIVAARMAVSGPWWAGVAALVAAAVLVSQEDRIWPKLPDGLQEKIVDQWRSRRGKVTKTTPGRVVWRIGRSVFWGAIAFKLLSTFSALSGPAFWIPSIGFGLSAGFFGVEASLATGASIAIAARFLMTIGLEADLTNPYVRQSFMASWANGAKRLSWVWAGAIGLSGPLWIGLSAAYNSMKTTIVEEMRVRTAAIADRKRIEARRARIKSRAMPGREDPLAQAKLDLEKAEERVKSASRGGGAAGGGSDQSAQSEVELTGVQKLEKMNMEGMLALYADAVRTIRESERVSGEGGMEIETDSVRRRSFDRTLLNMPDSWVDHIRESQKSDLKVLAAYYDSLCEMEEAAMRGGDGEVVTSSYVPIDDEEDDLDGMGPPSYMGGVTADADELPEVDALDGPDAMDEPEYEPDDEPPVRRGTVGADDDDGEVDEPSSPMPMLAGTVQEGRDGVPLAEGVLPLEDDVSQEESRLMVGESMTGRPVELGDGDGVSPDHGRDALPGDELVEAEMLDRIVAEDGSIVGIPDEPERSADDEREPSGERDADDHGSDPDEPVEPAEPDDVDPDRHASFVDLPPMLHTAPVVEQPEPVLAQPVAPAPVETEPHAESDDQVNDVPPVQSPAPEVPSTSSRGTLDQRRAVAATVLANKHDRTLVVESHDWFADKIEMATSLGVPDFLFDAGYASFVSDVAAYGLERDLTSVLDGDAPTPDAVDAAVAALVAAGWDHDRDLVARASKWSSDVREEARIAAETERLRLEEEARIAEVERVAQMRRDAEVLRLAEVARAEEAARVAEIARAAAAEKAAEQTRLAEEARRVELEAKRVKMAGWIISGQFTDEVLDDGSELFPDVKDLADSFGLPVSIVQERYDDFSAKASSRRLWAELSAAFHSEDINVVEALLERRDELGAYSGGSKGGDVDTIAGWARGVRERERVKGLTDVEVRTSGSGVEGRKAFLIKQNRMPPELARLIDDELPQQLKLVNSLASAIQLMGVNSPPAMQSSLDDARSRVRGIASRVVEQKDGKDVAKEYVLAFLPNDVREQGVNAWDMLLALADEAGDDDLIHDDDPIHDVAVEPVADAPAASDHDMDVVPATVPDRPVERIELPITRIGGLGVSFDANPRKSLEDVLAMDPVAEAMALPRQADFTASGLFNRLRMSALGALRTEDRGKVVIDDQDLFVPVVDAMGNTLGRLQIRIEAHPAPAWYDDKGKQIITRDVKTGEMLPTAATKYMRLRSALVSDANGHEDTTIGLAIVSPIASSDSIVSFQPMLESSNGTIRIIQVAGEAEIKSILADLGGA